MYIHFKLPIFLILNLSIAAAILMATGKSKEKISNSTLTPLLLLALDKTFT